jgi:hypothetical protein
VISAQGIYQDGSIILTHPVGLQDGAAVRVIVEPCEIDKDAQGWGAKHWPETPEEIAAFVAEMDATPGLEASDEEYAQMEEARKAAKARGIAENEARMERVTSLFR